MTLDVSTAVNLWTPKYLKGISKRFEKLMVSDYPSKITATQKSPYAVYLDGLLYDGDEAHITLTPGPDETTEWQYFHFTVTRAKNPHAFFVLTDGEPPFTTTTQVVGGNGRLRQAKEHYNDSSINDPLLINDIKADLEVIVNTMMQA